jgi:cytidylate kinase
MIITIDGPAGSGKSTAARGLAQRLGFEFLDTGGMYRAVAFALTRADIDFHSPRVPEVLNTLRLEMPPGRVLLNGEDVTTAIRTAEMNSASSKVAAVPAVRAFLVEQQRAIAKGRSMVCEGRDQGTVVFPDAICKFYLVADPVARARRRYGDLIARGQQVTFEQVLTEQIERDQRDSSRAVGPLTPAADAIHIDTSDLTPDQVLDRLEQEVRRCVRG